MGMECEPRAAAISASGTRTEKNEALIAKREAKNWKLKVEESADEIGRLNLEKASREQLGQSVRTLNAVQKSGTAPTASKKSKRRPLYMLGGMHFNLIGLAVNIYYPVSFLLRTAPTTSIHPSFTPTQIFLALYFAQVIHAAACEGMRTIYCVMLVPVYMSTLLVIPFTLSSSVAPTVFLAGFVGLWRVGICMSVCLHRYASHAAFKCGPVTQFLLNLLGCLANQGGPVWWASMHRCHHKYCDAPRDPHSPVQDGVENAFAFFTVGHMRLDEEFAPRHNDRWWLRLLDTWAFAPCACEMFAAHCLWGREGLFVSYTSQWLCQTITLWFNIANHPPDAHPGEVCQAANHNAKSSSRYPLFLLLDVLLYSWSIVVSEAAHDDHHVHFMLAKRERYDVMYHAFVLPLEKVGLVWDVKKFDIRE